MHSDSPLTDRLRRLLPETSFLRKLLMLASGTMAGQAILVLSSPLLTRLFTPAEFGGFAVFAAVAAIAGIGAGLRFELAVPIVREDADAAALVGMAAFCSAVTTALATLVIWLAEPWLGELVGPTMFWLWLWLLPLAMLLWGWGSALSFWSVRRGRFAVNGTAFTLQSGGQAGSQLVFGLFSAGVPGLITGFLVGYLVRFGYHAVRVPRPEWALIARPRPGLIRHAVVRNWRYPALALPSQLLESICQMAPVILVAWLFGPGTAGWYALGQRIIGLPVRVLSEAASQVLLGELRHLDSHRLHHFFLRTVFLFAGLGLLGMLPVLLFAPPLFALAFGEAWREAGVIVQLLVPFHLMRFVVIPISQVLYYLQQQAFVLLSSVLTTLAMLGSFGAGYYWSLEAQPTILLFSLTASASLALYLAVTWVLTKITAPSLSRE